MNDLGSVSPMLELARLMLESDELRAAADQDALRAARQEQGRALQEEMQALHDAADDVRTGAWVEGAMTIASGAAAATAHGLTPLGEQPTAGNGALFHAGEALGRMSGPAGRLVGEAPSLEAQADAKQAAKEGADAAMRAELAQRHYDRVQGDEDRVVAALESVLESESQGNLALIANV